MLARALLLVLYPLSHVGYSADSQDLLNDYADADVKNTLPKFIYLTAPDKPPEQFLEDGEVVPGEVEPKDVPIDRELLRLNPAYNAAVNNDSPETAVETTSSSPTSGKSLTTAAENVTVNDIEEPVQLVHVKPLCND